MSKAQRLRQYFKENHKAQIDSAYFDNAAAAAGTTYSYARTVYYTRDEGINESVKPAEEIIKDNLAGRKQDAKIKELKAINEQLLQALEESEARFDTLLNIKQYVDISEIVKIESNDIHEAIPIISISDVHFEERVEADVVNGVNEYNADIARERLRNVFSNGLKLVRMFQKDTEIKTVVIALLGDNITGYIHEELVESNTLSPTEATLAAKAVLIEGIKLFAEQGFRVLIPCARGNHGRTSARKKFSTGYKNSYEQMMYCDMAQLIKLMGYNNVEFIISKSEFTYLQIFNTLNRFCHGDHFKFAGGIGGIFPSMFKFLHRINEVRKADCTFMGHWHQYYAAARRGFVINGSVIGTNAYGLNFGADIPVQNIQLLDSKYGYTGNFPIVV